MSNVLIKDTLVVFGPLVAGPSTPPTPAKPAWDEVRTVGVILLSYINGAPVGTITETTVTIHHPAVPGSPGSPGALTPAYVLLDYKLGWSAGALSLQPLLGNGQFGFRFDQSNIGSVAGLGKYDASTGYQSIDYAFIAENGIAHCIEKGEVVSGPFAFINADIFLIVRVGSTVKYYQNNALRHTSVVPSSGVLYADASLYSGNDKILDATLEDVVDPTYGGNQADGGGGIEILGFGLSGLTATGGGTLTLMGGNANVAAMATTGSDVGVIVLAGKGYGHDELTGQYVIGGGAIELAGQGESGLRMPQYAIGYGEIYSFTGWGAGTDFNVASGGGEIGVNGIGSNFFYTEARGELALTGLGYGQIIFSWLDGGLTQPYQAVIFGSVGSEPAPITGFAGTLSGYEAAIYGGGAGVLTTTGSYTGTASGSIETLGRTDALLPTGTLAGYGGGQASIVLGEWPYTLSASGTVLDLARAEVTLPSLTVEAYAGGAADLTPEQGYIGISTGTVIGIASTIGTLPSVSGEGYAGGSAPLKSADKYGMSASGTAVIVGALDKTLPALTGAGSGQADLVAGLSVTHGGGYLADARGGAVAALQAPQATLTASGTVDWLARCSGTVYALQITASGSVEYVGKCDGLLPALQVSNVGLLLATLPRLTLRATGTTSVTVEYEAYSFTLLGEGVAATRYTNYPFDRIVRWRDKYLGVGADGLYELDGDDFDGAPIVASVQTAETDFGHPGFKRFPSMYFNGRVGADFDVAVVTAESEVNEYTGYRPVIKSGAGTHRVIFGKGIRAHYASYKFTNLAGEEFTIDSLSPLVEPLRRKV